MWRLKQGWDKWWVYGAFWNVQIVVFWVVTLCCLGAYTNIFEEHAVSTFSVQLTILRSILSLPSVFNWPFWGACCLYLQCSTDHFEEHAVSTFSVQLTILTLKTEQICWHAGILLQKSVVSQPSAPHSEQSSPWKTQRLITFNCTSSYIINHCSITLTCSFSFLSISCLVFLRWATSSSVLPPNVSSLSSWAKEATFSSFSSNSRRTAYISNTVQQNPLLFIKQKTAHNKILLSQRE